MKKYQLILSLLLLISLVIPSRLAAAIDEPYWTVVNNTLEALGVDTPGDDPVIIEATGTAVHYLEAFGTYAGGFECTGSGCGEFPVYILLDITVSWYTDYPIPGDERQYIYYEWGSMGIESDNREEVECGTGQLIGSCSVRVILTLQSEDIDHSFIYEDHDFESNVWVEWKLEGVWSFPTYQISTEADIAISSDISLLSDWGNCASQYLLGSEIGSLTLSSTSEYGSNVVTAIGSDYPAAGSWLAIKVKSGYWLDDGAGQELRSLAIKHGGGTWFPLDVFPLTGCYDSESDTSYIQIPSGFQPVYIRVDDDSNFASNTGSLSIGFYSISSYTRYPSGCELNYVVGDYVESKTVSGDMSNGLPLDQSGKKWNPRGGSSDYIPPKRYYMIETLGGPIDLGGYTYSYEADLAQLEDQYDLSPDTWHSIPFAPFVECYSQIDQVGHIRAYFALDEQIDLYEFERYWYAFRVRDTGSYTDNTGSLTYKLYNATLAQIVDPGTVPEVDGCSQFSHDPDPASSTIIYGIDNDGSALSIGSITYNSIMAIQVEGGAWLDNSVESYLVQISNDDGDTWHDLEDYPYLLCSQSDDGDHYLIYVTAAAGQRWRSRVKDTDSNFENNSQSITVSIYPGITSIDPFPTCEENYTLTYKNSYTIPGNIESGKVIPDIIGGQIYSIEITSDSKWFDGGTGEGSYLLELSDDDGDTWSPMADYADLCTEQIDNYGRFQIFFTAADGEYRLRAADDDFLDNTGSVVIKLYSGEDTSNPIPPGGNPIPPAWIVACDEVRDKPDSVIEWYGIVPVPRVADWLAYYTHQVIYYFAWCPEHTEQLQQIGGIYENKEPIKSLLDMRSFIMSIQSTVEGLSSMGGEGSGLESQEPSLFSDTDLIGESVGGYSPIVPSPSTNILDVFVVGNLNTESNPWFGGQLDLPSAPTVDLSSQDDYRAICEDKFNPLFGIMTWGYCYFMGTLRYSRIITWLLLVIDVGIVIWWIFKYFPNWIRRFMESLTGQKRLFGAK